MVEYAQILNYVKRHDVQLLVSDLNGVLDNYYAVKMKMLQRVLSDEYAHLVPELFIFMEVMYRGDNSTSHEDAIRLFFHEQGIIYSGSEPIVIQEELRSVKIVEEALSMLRKIAEQIQHVVIYSSLPHDILSAICVSVRDAGSISLFSAQHPHEAKPSVKNLRGILDTYNVPSSKACMIGDNLVDDLMPAKLLGMHAILVTPFADLLVVNSDYRK